MLNDAQTGSEIHWNRPTVCESSNFIGSRVAMGQIKVLCNELSDNATDAEFAEFVFECKPNMNLAITSFVEAFGPKQATEAEVKAQAKVDAAAAAIVAAEEKAAAKIAGENLPKK